VIDDEKEVPMELTLDSRTEGPFQIVAVGGEIDVYTAPRLREAIVAAIDAGHTRLVVDVEKVEFLDSTGLGVLVGALKHARTGGGDIALDGAPTHVWKVFQITGLDKVFTAQTSG
jgi:anti-sigma B factor antagonist